MFIPNFKCDVERVASTSVYGKRIYAPVEKNVPCAIVFMQQLMQSTSVRTDASGSHAAAFDMISTTRLLFQAKVPKFNQGDKITVMGFTLTVASIFPQHDVRGRFDHWQIDCTNWEG